MCIPSRKNIKWKFGIFQGYHICKQKIRAPNMACTLFYHEIFDFSLSETMKFNSLINFVCNKRETMPSDKFDVKLLC